MTVAAASQNQKSILLRLNLALALVEGLFVLWAFLREPSESQSAVFLGFSALRLVLFLVVLVIWLAIFLLLVNSFKRTGWGQGIGKLIWDATDSSATFWLLLLWIGLMYIPLFLSAEQLRSLTAYRERLAPILAWSVVISLQLLLSVLYLRSRGLNLFQNYRDVLLPSLVALLAIALFILFVTITRIGLKPDPIYWQEAGVPILLTQVFLVWAIGLIFYALISRLPFSSSIRLDVLVCMGLWLLACILWMSQPLRPAYNALEPSAPNFQSYPFGDALIYDTTAQAYLIGQPIPSDFSAKPLYSLFLAFLHLLAGKNYMVLISLQIVVLAVIPVFVYLFTKSLGNRPAGLIAALLLILRERNGIALSNVIQVSNVKLLLSDVFSLGLMAFLLWLLFRWFEKPENRRGTALAIGGVLALLALTREHPIILVPLVFGMILFVWFVPWRVRLQSLLLFTIGILLPLIPWFVHNYQTSGEFAFQDPLSPYAAHIAVLYSVNPTVPSPGNFPPRFSGETDHEYYARLRGQAFDFIRQHPDQVAKFVSAHYFHNAILSYIYLPGSFQIESLRSYVKTEPFWGKWTGSLSASAWVLLILNMGLLALGLGGSWKKKRILAVVPILMGMGYNVSVSVGRFSGWRFIQPVDWLTLVYYSIGLVQLSAIVQFVVRRNSQKVELLANDQLAINEGSPRWSPVIASALAFFLIGTALAFGHELFSPHVSFKSRDQLAEDYRKQTGSISGALSAEEMKNFLKTDNAVILNGEALYPAFFRADTGAFNYYWPSYQPEPYKRVVFYLLNSQPIGVVLPVQAPPSSFPDGAQVIVLGCKTEAGVVEAVSVLNTDENILYTRDPAAGLTCPLAEPK